MSKLFQFEILNFRILKLEENNNMRGKRTLTNFYTLIKNELLNSKILKFVENLKILKIRYFKIFLI